jgi:insulysin
MIRYLFFELLGNLETLQTTPTANGVNIREQLLEFHKKYYSANVMKLVVYGSQSLDTLQAWIEEKFSPIENKSLAYPQFPSDPYGPDELGSFVEIVPVKDMKSVLLYFPMPPVNEHFR